MAWIEFPPLHSHPLGPKPRGWLRIGRSGRTNRNLRSKSLPLRAVRRAASNFPGLSQNSKVPKQKNVIANQPAYLVWYPKGISFGHNPPDFQISTLENLGFYAYPGDCHTSDSVTGSQ